MTYREFSSVSMKNFIGNFFQFHFASIKPELSEADDCSVRDASKSNIIIVLQFMRVKSVIMQMKIPFSRISGFIWKN